jgi:hypothetical protein
MVQDYFSFNIMQMNCPLLCDLNSVVECDQHSGETYERFAQKQKTVVHTLCS